ncbi:MAG: site-specific integrase [Candidatus Methanomethylophilaceae archaeon]|nr:site-specific integrase [Candidatus Methanomethylophilaceae archaeon]
MDPLLADEGPKGIREYDLGSMQALEYHEGILSRYGDRSSGHFLISTGKRSIGRPMSARALQTVLERLAERSGVPFSPHCLRRLLVTTMSDAGVDLDTIRRMMRHSSIDTTLRRYFRANPRSMGAAVGAGPRLTRPAKLFNPLSDSLPQGEEEHRPGSGRVPLPAILAFDLACPNSALTVRVHSDVF